VVPNIVIIERRVILSKIPDFNGQFQKGVIRVPQPPGDAYQEGLCFAARTIYMFPPMASPEF
jgi:hypothetical protein